MRRPRGFCGSRRPWKPLESYPVHRLFCCVEEAQLLLIIQEVITHVTDMLSCQGLTDFILSLRFLTLTVTSAFSSRKHKQGVLSHWPYDSNMQTAGKVALSTKLLGKIPEYTEENLYFLEQVKWMSFTGVFFQPYSPWKKIKQGDKKLANLWDSPLQNFVKMLWGKVLITWFAKWVVSPLSLVILDVTNEAIFPLETKPV